MKKASLVLLGFITVLPLASIFLLTYAVAEGRDLVHKFFPNFLELHRNSLFIKYWLLIFIFSVAIVMLCLLIFYEMNLLRNSQLTRVQRKNWALLLFFGNIVTMPVFWYLYIWKPTNINRTNCRE
jgi:hypothetical protein